MSIQKTDYVDEGYSRLLDTLKGGPKLKALLEGFLRQAQALEDAAYPYYTQKNIDEAAGDRLDQIGAIVNIQRGGLDDDTYRRRIRAELAILQSEGTPNDVINVLYLLSQDSLPIDVTYIEAFPKSALLYINDYAWTGFTEAEMDDVLIQLQRSAAATTEIDLVYSIDEATTDNLFRFSKTADTTESSATYGTENGELAGGAI